MSTDMIVTRTIGVDLLLMTLIIPIAPIHGVRVEIVVVALDRALLHEVVHDQEGTLDIVTGLFQPIRYYGVGTLTTIIATVTIIIATIVAVLPNV